MKGYYSYISPSHIKLYNAPPNCRPAWFYQHHYKTMTVYIQLSKVAGWHQGGICMLNVLPVQELVMLYRLENSLRVRSTFA